jgi:hypothetical protein
VLSYKHGNQFTTQIIFISIHIISLDNQCDCFPNYLYTDAIRKMNILVTNDDGVTVPGLLALA